MAIRHDQDTYRPVRTLLSLLIGGVMLASCAPREDYVPGVYVDLVVARHARSIDDIDKALGYFEDALAHDQNQDQVVAEAFHLALMEGYYDRAERFARQMDAANSEDSVAMMFLALVELRQKNYAKARLYADKVNGGGFDAFLAPLVRGWLSTIEGQHEQALEAILPLSRVGYFDRFRREHTAHMLRYAGRVDEAEIAYRQVLASGMMTGFQSLLSYAELKARRGDRAGAIALLDPYGAQWRENVLLKDMLRRLKAGEKLPVLMVDDPVTAVASTLHYAAGQLGADGAYRPGLLYARLGAYLAPKDDDLKILIGNFYLNEDRVDEALRAFEAVGAKSLYHETVLYRRVAALNAGQQSEAAIGLLEAELAHAETPLLHSTIGDLYRMNGRYEDALAHYDNALKGRDIFDKADWFSFFSRGVCYEMLGRWADAENDFVKALELNPDEPQLLNYLGYSWVDRGYNVTKAREMIEKAHGLLPTSGAIIDSLGWVYFLLGRYDDAVIKLEEAVVLEVDDAVITDHLGDAYWMVGRRLEARYQWERALGYDIKDDHAVKIKGKLDYGLTGVKITPEGA